MQFKTYSLTLLFCFAQTALAFPRMTGEEFERVARQVTPDSMPDIRDGQLGRIIQYDSVPAFTGTKQIPGQ